jgi:hypothetical protein
VKLRIKEVTAKDGHVEFVVEWKIGLFFWAPLKDFTNIEAARRHVLRNQVASERVVS